MKCFLDNNNSLNVILSNYMYMYNEYYKKFNKDI